MMGLRPTKLDENGVGADSVLWSLRSPEGTCRTMRRASQIPQNGVCASQDFFIGSTIRVDNHLDTMLGRIRKIHFVGMGGIGMSGIAEILLGLGFAVSGSDLKATPVTERLEALGARFSAGHAAENVGEAEVVVVSSAVAADNPEWREAHRRSIPVIPRAEMLAELMRPKFSVAVAGAHGKTTVSSMIAVMLMEAGLDPTAVIGARLDVFDSSARLGKGELMVVEADESDRSFLYLFPAIAVLTNIDREHLDHYRDLEDIASAFLAFASKVPFYGAVVACTDAPWGDRIQTPFGRTCGAGS